MASRVTNQEARAFHLKHNAFGKSLKTPQAGGPMQKTINNERLGNNANIAEFKANHPNYPDYWYPDDQEEDSRIDTKMMATDFYRATPSINVTDRDIDWLARKEEARQLVKFKSFVEDSIPRGTPWAKEYFEKIMPGWYQSKIDIINDKMSIIQRFIEITIRGPQNIDDMFLLYNLYQGRIELPDTFEHLIRPQGADVRDGIFYSGLFNPRRFLSRSVIVSKQNQAFLANFGIPGVDFKGINDATGGRAGGGAQNRAVWQHTTGATPVLYNAPWMYAANGLDIDPNSALDVPEYNGPFWRGKGTLDSDTTQAQNDQSNMSLGRALGARAPVGTLALNNFRPWNISPATAGFALPAAGLAGNV